MWLFPDPELGDILMPEHNPANHNKSDKTPSEQETFNHGKMGIYITTQQEENPTPSPQTSTNPSQNNVMPPPPPPPKNVEQDIYEYVDCKNNDTFFTPNLL